MTSEALRQVRDDFISMLVQAFVAAWESGEYFRIWKTIREQEDLGDLRTTLFTEVLELGNQEKQRIDALKSAYQRWQPLEETIGQSRPVRGISLTPLMIWREQRESVIEQDLAEAARLCQLVQDTAGILPTEDWTASVSEYKTMVARSMVSRAEQYAADPSTHRDALEILEVIKYQGSFLDAEFLGRVNREVEQLTQRTAKR